MVSRGFGKRTKRGGGVGISVVKCLPFAFLKLGALRKLIDDEDDNDCDDKWGVLQL